MYMGVLSNIYWLLQTSIPPCPLALSQTAPMTSIVNILLAIIISLHVTISLPSPSQYIDSSPQNSYLLCDTDSDFVSVLVVVFCFCFFICLLCLIDHLHSDPLTQFCCRLSRLNPFWFKQLPLQPVSDCVVNGSYFSHPFSSPQVL